MLPWQPHILIAQLIRTMQMLIFFSQSKWTSVEYANELNSATTVEVGLVNSCLTQQACDDSRAMSYEHNNYPNQFMNSPINITRKKQTFFCFNKMSGTRPSPSVTYGADDRNPLSVLTLGVDLPFHGCQPCLLSMLSSFPQQQPSLDHILLSLSTWDHSNPPPSPKSSL